MSAPRVSIVLPTLEGERDLESLLPALARQKVRGGFELIAIDSDSKDRTRELLERFGARVTRIPRDRFGHGRTRNQAAAEARGELLVFLSQDATPRDDDFLERLCAACDPSEGPAADAAFARILPRADDDALTARTVLAAPEASSVSCVYALAHDETWESLSPKERAERARFNDVASCIRADRFREQPFQDVAFGEDVAWAMQALARGWTIRYEPRAVVLHAHRYGPRAAWRRYATDARFQRDVLGLCVRPTWSSVVRGILFELVSDVRFVRAKRSGWSELLRAPFVRGAQVLGQYAGGRPTSRA